MLDRLREWMLGLFRDVLGRVHPVRRPIRAVRMQAPPHVDQGLPQIRAIEKAHQQVLAARSYFDCVSEPELVDIAIYSLQAAQLRYSYLIRQAKQDRVRLPGLGGMLAK